MSAEIIAEVIIIVAIFAIGAAILLWAVADGVSGARFRQRSAANASSGHTEVTSAANDH